MRGETSIMTTSQPSSSDIRAASSPGPPPTSSTRCGAISATAPKAISRGSGPSPSA